MVYTSKSYNSRVIWQNALNQPCSVPLSKNFNFVNVTRKIEEDYYVFPASRVRREDFVVLFPFRLEDFNFEVETVLSCISFLKRPFARKFNTHKILLVHCWQI